MGSPMFARRLNAIFETDATSLSDDPYQTSMDIANELEAARRTVADLERQLTYSLDRLCGGLALGVRKNQPGLNVGLDKGNCRVGYRSKSLMLKPDLTNKVWLVDSGDPAFARRFKRIHGPRLNLSNDMLGLSTAVAHFFNDHYRSLGEEIFGDGKIIYEGRQITLGMLAEMMMKNDCVLSEVRA